ncbi:type ISP restriction/modification enzyme [uncultured Helicobacter sp.]|uniref:type ISP restriction/modification enzyme n=6 Tax=uncultured Helicobacter sp. TaxID=175537 RepID=UPI0025DBCFE2|nr:type ISP restriction/modification enzyme [uncultured Helicobacter sp.]
MIQALSDYQNALASTLRTNEYNEHSFRTFLENLLNVLKNDDKCYIIHEPKAEVGQGHIRPDYKVYKRIDSKNTLSYNALMGFIECKQWGEDLNAHIKGKQLDKYLQICPNIMLTNYNRFILISFGTIISDTTLFDYGLDTHLFKDMQDSILAHKLKDFQALLSDFFNATQAAIKSKAEVIKILSTQSFYLALKARESYHEPRRTSFHKFFEKTYETFRNITRYEFAQEEFCDILGQSVVYGLLVAHLESESYSKNDKHIEITQLEGFVNLLPKEFALLSEFIYFAIPSFHIPASVAYALENIKKAIALIDKRTLATALNTQIESVAIYLYEDFLKAYDELRGSEKRKEGGVFYTPQSVVNCIVSSIHEILKKHFNKPKGLAHKDVKVLDFATGTGSFLAKVFELILQEEQSKIFQIMDIKDKFLKDIYGFELSFVPYIVAHIKLSTILKNAGFSDFSDEHKLQIFLTNTLDLSINADYQMTMPLVLLEEQDKEARKIKHKEEVLVILGNPPYYQNSKNNLPEIIKLHNTYKVGLNETNLQPLNNDYIKFIRFAQWKLLERTDPDPKAEVPLFIDSHSGIMGFITPNSYLYGRVHRKMRESLYTNFDSIYIINLHGDNEKDENVFDIRVGVCISLFVKCNSSLTQDTRITNNKKCKSLESLKIQSENSNLNTSLRDFEKVEAIHNKTSHKDSMDCHEAKASRNDNAACHTEAKVSHKNIDSNSNIQRNKDSIQERTSHSTIYCKEATLEQSPKLFYFSTANNHIFKRADKYNLLNDIAYKGLDCIQWQELNPQAPYFWFIPCVLDNEEYEDFWALAEDKALKDTKAIFERTSSGIKTQQDKVCIQFNETAMQNVLNDFLRLDTQEIYQKYQAQDQRDWSIERAKQDVIAHYAFSNPSSHIPSPPYSAENAFSIISSTKAETSSKDFVNDPSPTPPASGGATNLTPPCADGNSAFIPPPFAEGVRGWAKPQAKVYRTYKHRYLAPYMKTFSREMRKNPTQAEKILWQELRNKKLGYGFRRQFVIDSQYIADFICLAKRLIIECDGGGHNGNFKDIERDFYLQSHNFRILRFWNNEILENLGGGLSQHSHIQKIAYRPFDTRYTFFSGKTKGFLGYPRYDTMQHFLQGENLGLCFPKQTYNPYFDYGFVIDVITDVALGGKNTGSETYIAPLYRYQNTTGDDNTQTDKIEKIPNFTESFRNYCQSHTILKHKSPEQILYFIYANLYNPIYRNKYAEYLKIGFPRIHFDVEESYFDTLESYGKKLIALHLMRETPKDSTIILDFRENANTNNPSLAIKKLNANKRHLAHCLILNDDLHITGVSEDVYNYTIGGYKVIEKWLSYRADYVCSKAELEHLVNICKVIKATLTLEQELEKC